MVYIDNQFYSSYWILLWKRIFEEIRTIKEQDILALDLFSLFSPIHAFRLYGAEWIRLLGCMGDYVAHIHVVGVV